ncbi:MAG: hypothetical protein HKN48_13935 [Flavobacteriaceae bacterium]|nr:hypothetical protein [Flavobacteriaceae bacterium]
MAPIKFEENIREKLQERELQPKKESWEKLSATLEKQSPQKRNKFAWFAVAASVAGILLVLTLIFNQEGVEGIDELVLEDTNEIIDAVNETEELPNNLEVQLDKEVLAVDSEAKIESNDATTLAETTSNETPEETNVSEEIQNNFNNEAVAINEVEEFIEEQIVEDKLNPEELFVEDKVKEVVASVQEIQNSNNTVTAEEIDALLAKANREIANHKILSSKNYKVDAAALLLDVETELERSFRDRVFEALGEGFNKVRTAVAERNN